MAQGKWWLIPASLILGCSPALATLVVDGDLSDWGVVVADNNGSTYSFAAGVNVLGSHVEDQPDDAPHSFNLGPNLGGQDYDGELLVVARQDDKLFIAIVTGQRPDNGARYFGPGDIRIETDLTTYGIEVGGGAGGGDGSAITAGAPGSTYTMATNGDTKLHTAAAALQTAGSMWRDVTWLLDPINPQGPVQIEIGPNSTLVGMAEYVYTRDAVTTQHAIVELAIDLSLFSQETIQSIHWRPSCGNDELDATVRTDVPEPATLLFLMGGGLVIWTRRR